MAKQLAAWYSDIWKKQLLSQLETDKVNTKPDITSGGRSHYPHTTVVLGYQAPRTTGALKVLSARVTDLRDRIIAERESKT